MATETGTVEIREVTGEEFVTTGRPIANYAFGASPHVDEVDVDRIAPFFTHARFLVAFVDGTPQATLTTHEMTQNVRGAVVPMGGIGGVASMPAGRRRGAVRAMFERVYAMHREAGMPISALYPFRDSFYERMGYAGFPKPRFLTLNPEALAPLVRLDMRGTCEQVAMKDGFNEWRAFLERYQAQTHGFALKHVTNARRWQDDNAWWLAMARDDDGEIVGAMTYKITGYTEKLIASTFYTTSATGRYQLLDWVGRHADQVKEAILELRPDDYPEIWFRDLEASVTCGIDHAWPAPMARVIDVARLTGIGAGSGEIALTIEDAHCPWNADTFTFRGDGDTLTVEPGGEAAATLTIQGLSALVFSGRDPATFPFRGWGAPDAAAAESLRAIFPCAIPDIHETF